MSKKCIRITLTLRWMLSVAMGLLDGKKEKQKENGKEKAAATIAKQHCAFRCFYRLGWHRRTEQPPKLVMGRWYLQIHRWWQDLEEHGPRRNPPHWPRGDSSEKSGCCLCGRARPPLGSEPGPRSLQNHGWRQDLEPGIEDQQRYRR